jgi:hypothetical protein
MIGSALGAALGSDKVTPRYLTPSLNKPLTELGKSALNSLQTGGAAAEQRFNLGTQRQEDLLGEQGNLYRDIINRRMGADPNQLLQSIGNTAFSFINPNVVAPLAQFDVNSEKLMRAARGLNPASVDSTGERLRNARVASGRYLDTARQAYGALPGLYNSAYGQGVNNEQMATSYLPQLAAGYRALDTAPAEAAQIRADLANSGAGSVGNINQALKGGVYGYKQDRNVWDRLGAADQSITNSTKDLLGTASQLAGAVGGAGGGGSM